MDIFTYAGFSALIITIWHFSMNTQPRNWGLMQMIALFVFGGAIGWYMESLIFGLIFSILFSLFFIH